MLVNFSMAKLFDFSKVNLPILIHLAPSASRSEQLRIAHLLTLSHPQL
jgi:hypothetical protein